MEKRLHHLTKAVENLTKVEEEMSKFRTWIVTDEQKLHIHNECLQRCEDLQALAEEHKVFFFIYLFVCLRISYFLRRALCL